VTLYENVFSSGERTTLRTCSPLPILLSAYSLDEIPSPTAPGSAAFPAYSALRLARRFPSCHLEAEISTTKVIWLALSAPDAGWFFVTIGAGERPAARAAARAHIGGASSARDLFRSSSLSPPIRLLQPPRDPLYPVSAPRGLILPFTDFRMGPHRPGVYGGRLPSKRHRRMSLSRALPPESRFAPYCLDSFHPWSHGADLTRPTMQHKPTSPPRSASTDRADVIGRAAPGGESGDWQWDAERVPGADPKAASRRHRRLFRGQGSEARFCGVARGVHGASSTFSIMHPDVRHPYGIGHRSNPRLRGTGFWECEPRSTRLP